MKVSCHVEDLLYGSQTVGRAVSSKNTLPILSGIMTVSYTHLDVYKRQRVGTPKRAAAKDASIPACPPPITITPYSFSCMVFSSNLFLSFSQIYLISLNKNEKKWRLAILPSRLPR